LAGRADGVGAEGMAVGGDDGGAGEGGGEGGGGVAVSGGNDGSSVRRWIHVSSALFSEGKIALLQKLLLLMVEELFLLISDGEVLAGGGGRAGRRGNSAHGSGKTNLVGGEGRYAALSM